MEERMAVNEALVNMQQLRVPIVGLSKQDIEASAKEWARQALEIFSAGEAYLFLKQLEYAAKMGLEAAKERAFNSFATSFQGEMSGTVLKHTVELRYPREWLYSSAVDALKEKQKFELKGLQLLEQSSGAAIRIDKPGIITVTLREK